MLEKLAEVCGRLHILIRIRELATLHKYEQMRRIRMLEQQATRKRENGFERIKILAERHEEILRRLNAGFDSEPFYTGLFNVSTTTHC